jgi:hypothetical protein
VRRSYDERAQRDHHRLPTRDDDVEHHTEVRGGYVPCETQRDNAEGQANDDRSRTTVVAC